MGNSFIVGADSEDGIYFFNGYDIERFLLKVLCAYTAQGYFRATGSAQGGVPLEWVEILFGEKDFGPAQGLYVPRGFGVPSKWGGRLVGGLDSVAFNRAITVAPVGPEDDIQGVFVRFNAHWFLLRMGPTFNPQWLAPFDLGFQYRPRELHFRSFANEQTLVFFWDRDQPQEGSSVCYRVEGQLPIPVEDPSPVLYHPHRYGP